MKQWLKKYKAWQSRRKVRSLIEWERTRAKGKARFVWDWTWRYGLLMIPAAGYLHYFSVGAMQSWQSAAFWGEAIRYLTTGAFVAFSSWGLREYEYNRIRLGHSKIPAELLAPPPNQSSGFTQH